MGVSNSGGDADGPVFADVADAGYDEELWETWLFHQWDVSGRGQQSILCRNMSWSGVVG